MFQARIVEGITTYILFPITFLENHAVSEVVWKTIVEPDSHG
jgi:hypothetical protein